jgi:hypothetical protein
MDRRETIHHSAAHHPQRQPDHPTALSPVGRKECRSEGIQVIAAGAREQRESLMPLTRR